MPYKQPKNTPMHNKDGASEPISIITGLVLAGKALAAKAGAVAAKVGAKTAAKAAVKKGTQVAAKKATKIAADKALKKSIKKAGREGLKQARKSMSFGEKVKNVGMKAENLARKGADKISNVTGQDFDKSLDFVKQKAKNVGVNAATTGVRKIQEATQNPATTADNFLPNEERRLSRSSSYSNPMGPSAKISQGTKTNQGTQRTNPPVFSSLSKSNLKQVDDSIGGRILEGLKNVDANINIKGVPVNVGDVIRTGAGIARGANKMVKDRKKLKEIERRAFNKKQSAARAKEEEDYKKIMQDIKPVSDKKGL